MFKVRENPVVVVSIGIAALVLAVGLLMPGGSARAGTESIPPDKLPVKGMVNLVDVGAGQCIPCRAMAPILGALEKKYRGRAVVAFVDLRYHPGAARRFGVRIIPTQIFYDSQGREVFRHQGFLDRAGIESVFTKMGVK